MSILIWTLTECFPVHLKHFCKFSKNSITIWHFYSNFSTPAIFFEEMEPMFAIHNISIATDDYIIQFGDDANIYPGYSSRAIIIWGNCLNWLEKTIFKAGFCQFLVSWFGNLLIATECIYAHPFWFLKIEISLLASLDMTLSKPRMTKALIRLRGCAGWSVSVLFTKPRRQVFSRRCPLYLLGLTCLP